MQADAPEPKVSYRALSASDYAGMMDLIVSDGGHADRDGQESPERIGAFLERNTNYCFAAVVGGSLIGIIMCGCDGRSARIYHLNVSPEWRRRGVAHALIGLAYGALRSEGVDVVDVIVFREDPGTEFWDAEGFRDRDDLSYRDFSLSD